MTFLGLMFPVSERREEYLLWLLHRLTLKIKQREQNVPKEPWRILSRTWKQEIAENRVLPQAHGVRV